MRVVFYLWLLAGLLVASAVAQQPQHDSADAAQVVHRFYTAHFSGDMAFTTTSVAKKSQWLSPELAQAIAAWFAQPQVPDEVPNINGDPFTNTQEYPTKFAVGSVDNVGASTQIPVTFDVGGIPRVVKVVLSQVDNEWRIVDLLYEDGVKFSQLLSE